MANWTPTKTISDSQKTSLYSEWISLAVGDAGDVVEYGLSTSGPHAARIVIATTASAPRVRIRRNVLLRLAVGGEVCASPFSLRPFILPPRTAPGSCRRCSRRYPHDASGYRRDDAPEPACTRLCYPTLEPDVQIRGTQTRAPMPIP